MKILLTGGAGFIGSHTLIELTEAGHEAVVVDNLDNSSPISLKRVAKIIGKEVPFYKVDIRDREGLQWFHIFTHINSGHCHIVIKQIFCQGFCHFGFTNTGWPQKHKAARRTTWIT